MASKFSTRARGNDRIEVMLNSIYKIWCRLSGSAQIVFVSALLAVFLTILFGVISSQEVFRLWSKNFAPWPFGVIDWLVNTAILAVAIFVLVSVTKKIRDRSQSPGQIGSREATQYRLLDDIPVEQDGTDELERENFVRTLSRTIVLPPKANSLVLALEAPWGAGKSSILSLLANEIEEHPDQPLVIRFNPWLATGHDRIFRAFFSQFSAALLEKGERDLASRLVSFGEALEDLFPARARIIPRIGFTRFRRLVGNIPVIDLEGEQDNLRTAVAETGRPIVVIIDDIDRLAPEDIRVVFQLVKAIAAFPRVAYLLAFDPDPIDRALSFGEDAEKGRQFRDKIVQANIALPRIRYRTRKKYFSGKIEDRLEAWQFSLGQHENRLLEKAVPLVLGALRTPRDMKRVLNKTLLTADNVRKEVNFADVLVFETLHAKYPKIAENIRLNPRIVDPMGYGDEETLESDFSRMIGQEMDGAEDKPTKLDEIVRVYPEDRQVPASLLRFAFPPIFDDSPDSEDVDYAGDRRIALHENLLKLLYQGLHGEILSADEATEFLGGESGREAFLADVIEVRSLPAWLAHLRRFVESTPIAAPGALMRRITLAVNSLYERSRVDASEEARWLLLDIIKVISEADRKATLAALFQEQDTAPLGEEILVSLLRDAGMWENGEYFGLEGIRPSARSEFSSPTPEELDELRAIWLSTIRRIGARRIILKYPNAVGVLFRWGQLAERPYAEVAIEVDDALDDPDVARGFLALFPAGVGLSGVEKFVLQTAWEKLKALLDEKDVPDPTRTKFLEYFEGRDPRDIWPRADANKPVEE